MGRRGPPPIPTEIKRRRGTLRPGRTVAREMTPTPGTPEMPPWLDDEAAAEWARVVPHLVEAGVLTEMDRGALAAYVVSWSRWVRAEQELSAPGQQLILMGPQGPVKNPLIGIAREARAQARLLGAELGLSPSSRSRIGTPPQPMGEDEAEQFLFGKPRLVP